MSQFILVNPTNGKVLSSPIVNPINYVPKVGPAAGSTQGNILNLSDENLKERWIAKLEDVVDPEFPNKTFTRKTITESYNAETNTYTRTVKYIDMEVNRVQDTLINTVSYKRKSMRDNGVTYKGKMLVDGVLVDTPLEGVQLRSDRVRQGDLADIIQSFNAGSTRPKGFRLGVGKFIPLADVEAANALLLLGSEFIEDCFAKQSELEALILSKTTVDELRTLNTELNDLFVVDGAWVEPVAEPVAEPTE